MRKRTVYDVAVDYMRLGVVEKCGAEHNYIVMAMLTLFNAWPKADEVPWCSAAMTFFSFNAGVQYSKSLLARSWLGIGEPIELDEAHVGNDIVILQRGSGVQPGAENRTAPGHVGLFAGCTPNSVFLLGGNQGDMITITESPATHMLGIRRLAAI